MKVKLTATFELTDERIGSSYARPLLVNLSTGRAYAPKDIIEPYPFWGFKPAAAHVARMIERIIYTDEEVQFIKRFCNARRSGPSPG